MKQGHYFEHIIYNENFLVIMEEFKSLILSDERISNYCCNNRLRFSAAIRWFVMTYVNKYSKSNVMKEHISKLKSSLELKNKKESIRDELAKERDNN